MKSIGVRLALCVVLVGLSWFVPASLVVGGQQSISPQSFSEPAGYLTHISTDKPIYRTGERAYVRAVLLRADSHVPRRPGEVHVANFVIRGPKGNIVATGATQTADSVLGFSWDIPASEPGGEYAVRISHPVTGDAPAERKFDIRAYRAPRLKSQIVFVRDGYGPGDTVGANLHVDRAEGGVPANAKVSVVARVDGEEVWTGRTSIDRLGNASVNFKLPAVILRDEGTIAMTIEDGGIVETASKTIPILLQTLDLAIYPEGGDLVAGLPNRVYLEGRTPSQKPADVAGVVLNSAGDEVVTFRTEHEGRGRFTFVPTEGQTYKIRLKEPAGIRTVFSLPAVKATGAVISSTRDVTRGDDDVVFNIATTNAGRYGIALTQRGREVSFKAVTLKAREFATVAFTLPRNVDGVLVATLYDDQKMPMAERLVFRRPERQLNVRVAPDREDYVPGDKVTLRVTTSDDSGRPVGAMVGLTVTDSSVLELIDKREQAPRLPVMVLLENDVKNLADAHIYLDETNPKARLATDLLLGTQGWRRFATMDISKFVATNGDAARRMLGNSTRIQLVPGGAGGHIGGIVADSSGALIPGVTMTATLVDTNQTATVGTNPSGAYNFSGLPPGRYTLSASLPGFQTKRYTGIQLNPTQTYRYNFQLAVAGVNTQVEVSVAANMILPQQAPAVGQVLEPGRFQDLPLVGNNILDLNRVMDGVRADNIAIVRDGIVVQDLRNVINPDLVGEIRLILQPVDAEQARKAVPERFAGAPIPRAIVVVTREYAHSRRANWTEGSRSDFSETVYWNAGIRTDESTGVATVSFDLSDSVTSFRVMADAFTQDGTLGSITSHVESVKPFSIEPKLPLQVTSGDVIQLPIGIVNGVNRSLGSTEISAKTAAGLKVAMLGDTSSTLRARERTRRLMQIDVGRQLSGAVELAIDASAGPYKDSVRRSLDIQPHGFPYETSSGGVLEPNSSKEVTFTLPQELVRGSAVSSVVVYPSPLANMTQSLQSLLREPHGCFEQTSATSYPMVMAQQYFMTHTGVDPAIIEKTRGLLDSAYKKLTGFQSRSGGYEWFGADPGHEALTAYGFMQFTDMAQVRNVDKDMLDRTGAWLLSRRDGRGGFNRNSRALDSFGGASAETTNAYITWALAESGRKDLENEAASLRASAKSTDDSYIIALAANVLHATGDKSGAHQLMARLAKAQNADGSVKGARSSITRSGGQALEIETTALAALAWMREPAYAGNVEKSMKWIVESNKGGRFGSTQSTILSLRAIIAHDAAHARPKAPGRILVTVDGKPVGVPVAFGPESQGAIVLPDFGSELGPGKHTVALKMEDGSSLPYSLTVKYNSALPDSSDQAKVGIQVSLRDRRIQEGGITEAVVSVTNRSSEAIPTPIAIVGIPGGLEVRHDQLKELVKSGRIDAYEIIGREVILYWRFLRASDRFDIPLSLVAAIPGSYTGPASRAYLYYTDEHKDWAPGLSVNITPR